MHGCVGDGVFVMLCVLCGAVAWCCGTVVCDVEWCCCVYYCVVLLCVMLCLVMFWDIGN